MLVFVVNRRRLESRGRSRQIPDEEVAIRSVLVVCRSKEVGIERAKREVVACTALLILKIENDSRVG